MFKRKVKKEKKRRGKEEEKRKLNKQNTFFDFKSRCEIPT